MAEERIRRGKTGDCRRENRGNNKKESVCAERSVL